ncbi:hypothetical protein L0128_07665 [candidate division KSB1 bacterium]|nr:hypothetical protein [candidate division KSB1 bacterium]
MKQEAGVAILESRLQKGQRHFTLNEAAAVTGISIDESRDALNELIAKYVCRLQVTEKGELIYDFGKNLLRRGQKTLAEISRDVMQWLWKVFTIIFKIWIAVTLVVYFVIFLVMLIVALTASSSRKGDSRRRGGGANLDGLFNIFLSIFRWRTFIPTIRYRQDQWGYPYQQYQPRPSIMNEKKKNFMASVYDFVFGPQRVPIDPLSNQKEVAAYLKQQQGILVTSELNALAGWTLPQAQTFLTDCLVRFQGKVDVTENGVVYAEFEEILRGVGQMEGGRVVHYWDEYEPEQELTGNSAGYNWLIFIMNGFNLFFAINVISASPTVASGYWEGQAANFSEMLTTLLTHLGPPATLFLGWIPFVFSTLFFAIPLVRWVQISMAKRKRHLNNIRKRIFKAIFKVLGKAQPLDAIVRQINSSAKEEQLASATVEKLLKELTLDLNGELVVSEQAQILYSFPRITAELDEVAQLRARRQLDTSLGAVIADSE